MDSTQTTNEVSLFKIKDFKTQAKAQLKNKKKGPVLITLISALFLIAFYMLFFPLMLKLSYAPSTAAFFRIYAIMLPLTLIWGLLLCVVYFAMLKVLFKLNKTSEEVTLGDFFKSFSIWKKAIGSALYQFLFIFLWELAIILPVGIIGGITAAFVVGEYEQVSIILFIIWYVAYIFAIVFIYRKVYQYSQMFYLVADKPETAKIKESLKTSIKMTKGYKRKLFLLDLSFYGWAILCVLTLGILTLWILPYYYMTKINAYNFLRKVNNLDEEKIPLESPTNEE